MSEQARILVVNDDAHRLRATSRALKQAGYRVTEAGTGAEGLRLAKAHRPDLILLRVALPDMDGIELCQRVKGEPALTDCLVVILSDAQTSPDDQAGGLEAGADGYIVRPISDRELLARVMALLRIKRAEADVADLADLVRASARASVLATEALRQERDRAQRYLDIAGVMFLALDVNGEIALINRRGSEILGYDQEEIIGKNWFDRFVPRDIRDQVRAVFHRLIAGEVEPVECYENPVLTKDGEERVIAWHNIILEDGQGNIVGTLSSGEDVTERKRAHEALQKSEKKFRTLVENVVDWVWQVDRNGVYTYVSPQVEQRMGYSVSEVLGKTPFHFMAPQEAERVGAIFSEIAAKRERILGLEDTLLTKDGREILFETNATPLFDAQSAFIGYMGTCRDITERKRTEEALRESECQKNLILNATAEMVAYYDRDLRVVWANRAAGQSVGKSPQELVGLHCYEVWHQRDEPCAGCPVLKARDAKEPQQGEQQTPDGRYWFLRGYPILDEEDKVIGLVEFGQDISERKRAEAEIARAAEALQESEEELTLTLNATTEGIWKWEFESNELSFSPRYYTMLGYEPDEFPASYESWVSLIHPDDRQQALAVAEEYLATKTDYYENEFRLRTKGGDYRWIRTEARVVARDEQGQALRMIGNHRDITQRKRAEAEVARAAEALRRRNRELATLNRAGQALVSILDLDQVLVKVLEEVRGLLSVTASSIWLVDPETSELVCKQVTGPQKERVRGWRLAPGQGLAGRAARSGQSLIAPDVRADERHFKEVDRQTGLPLRSILTIPLRIKNGVIGVLQVVDTEVDRFDAGDLKLLEPLVTSAAIAIENARLYQQTRRDAETRSALLREVNHRVKNNLTSILGLLYTARDRVQVDERAAYLCTMDALIRRVRGLATAHDLLSASRWAPLRLSDLASRVIHVSLETLSRHKRVSVHVPVSPVRVTADQAHNLALVIGELTTNAAKHALKGRDTACISFQVELEDEDGDDLEHASPMIRCEFRDDGPGYPEEVLALERRNVGFDLIHNIVRKGLRGTLTLHNDGGAVAVIRFEAQVQER